MTHSVLETVQKAPYKNNESAGDAIKVLEGASMAELSYALANTSIMPTTIARIVAFNSQLSENILFHEQLELLSNIRTFSSQISWAEAELYGSGIERLVQKVASMDDKLTVLKAYILYDFAESYDAYYGKKEISLAHSLFVTCIGDRMPALTAAILVPCRLAAATQVFVPTKKQIWDYFHYGALFLSKEKRFREALFLAVASLTPGRSQKRSAILVSALSLIVHGEVWPLGDRLDDSDVRIFCKDLQTWFEYVPTEDTGWDDQKELADAAEPLRICGMAHLIPHIVLSRRLHRLRVLHRTIRRTDWEQLKRTGPESLDQLISAGYKGQVYMDTNLTIIESPDYRIQLTELYDLLEKVVQVAERLESAPQLR